MPKKKSVKKVSSQKKLHNSHVLIGLTIMFVGVFCLLAVTKFALSSPHVLGAQTLLARGGDDGSDDNSGSGTSSNSGSSNTDQSGNVNSTSPEPTHSETHTSDVPPAISSSPQPSHRNTEITRPTPTPEIENESEPVEVESKDQQTTINLKEHGTVVELKSNQGKIELQAKQEDGSKVELGDDSLQKINISLTQDHESAISHDTSGNFVLTQRSTRAKTTLPISVNLETNQLTVTTAKGSRVVTILPDDVVKRLRAQQIIDTLDPTSTNAIQLTENNGSAVFEIQGQADQNLLGLLPVTIHKKITVSAETGLVQNTEESFGQSLLDVLSF